MNRFTAIDLFSGAGGLTVGLKKGGFDVLACVEINESAIETYKMNHKNHLVYSCDIRKLSPAKVMLDLNLKKGDLDLLAGCPPCQGFSSHRTRNQSTSVCDERNDLVFEFIRFVKELRPKTIMMENVPGLAKDDRMITIKRKLKEFGYYIDDDTVQVKNAVDYGVPQRRKRMILQASIHGYIEQPKKSKKQKTVYEAISNLKPPGKSGDSLHDITVIRSPRVMEMIKLIPKNGGSRMDLPEEYWLPCHKKYPGGYRDVYGRMSWNDVSPTITGGCNNPSKGRFIHPEDDRAITLREAAILQTFPRSYKFSLTKGTDSVALMIGNALPPEFIKRHAKQYHKHLTQFYGAKNNE